MNYSLTYGQLLELAQWLNKRKVILNRDKNVCQKCNNKSYEKDKFYNVFIKDSHFKPYTRFVSFDGKEKDIFLNDENGIAQIPSNKKVMLYLITNKANGINDIPDEGYFVAAARELTNEEIKHYYPKISEDLKNKITSSSTIENLLQGKPLNIKLPIIEELNIKLTKEHKWIFVKDLHVHHTYYQINKLPWEYPDESLQTLCRTCHEITHENEKIPVKDLNGFIIGNYKPCSRCHGAGWFPEYSHVEKGICFKCFGAKYLSDEFIIKN